MRFDEFFEIFVIDHKNFQYFIKARVFSKAPQKTPSSTKINLKNHDGIILIKISFITF